jgi:hypothetical protein
MATVTFDQCWGYAKAKVACRQCGRISERSIREWCTVNPFNTNEAGEPRSHGEVKLQAQARAEAEAARQETAGRICRKCEQVSA